MQTHPLLDQTFSLNSKKLPTNAEVRAHIFTDRSWIEAGEYDKKKMHMTMQIRELYLQQTFAVLTNDFLLSFHDLCQNFPKISEICAGLGWLSHWLEKYQVKIKDCIDDKSWHGFQRESYLANVTEMDSLYYVQNHPEVDLFILSWPYVDNIAARIWQALRPGQHLLYIGELQGGCTANDAFFTLIVGQEMINAKTKKMRQSFLSFDDFHDKPYLFRKGKYSK